MAWSCGKPSNVKGVDVSAAQGPYPSDPAWWRLLRHKHRVQCGIIKASEGISYVNPYLKSSWQACTAANGEHSTGLYHFLDWQYSGVRQAEHFWNSIKPLVHPVSGAGAVVLVIDVEEPNGISSTAPPSPVVVNDLIEALSTYLNGR